MRPSTANFSRPALRSRFGLFAAILAGVSLTPGLFAASTSWTGAVDDDWTNAGNWDGGLPTSALDTIIPTGEVVLDGTGSTRFARLGTVAGTTQLTINSGASLTNGGAGAFAAGLTSGATVAIIQNGGSVDINNSLYLGGTGSANGGDATYTVYDGLLDVSGSLGIGNSSGGSTTTSFIQQGGDVTLGSLDIGSRRYGGGAVNVNDATYEVSGGTLAVTGNWNQGLDEGTGNGRIESTGHVIGSKSTISVGGNMVLKQNTQSSSTLRYTLDNGGVSKINLTNGGAVTLAGTLETDLMGGMVLTSGNTFSLIETAEGGITNGFSTLPDSELWNVEVVSVGGGREALQLSLNAAALQGTVAAGGSAAFAATGKGYVELTGLSTGSTVSIYLNADAGTGLTIADLVNYLDQNGIVASTTSEGGYNVLVSIAAPGETAYYTWDLSGFNGDATISGLMVIPEPASTAALAGLAVLAVAYLFRRKRR
ncbi:PEP-CTERM sorting domain-containing protein [Ruficoccus amylovorans]|uniref:PEP-CTERM sorting domain-containing protein n=1 Tax=Ruficoccus amylovorans TaxID=1804625 RepID=A0A842HFP4_9BACT|nr:PEP-CTERM sorting domain-containing protein [Ruficoccus amylovorans]MBC2595222.1 PEP-CTERM sorting domain-containing protein [Ruficoccus amylovorans]